jgi:5'-nucleotidase (lipoprotein e(P4) family)
MNSRWSWVASTKSLVVSQSLVVGLLTVVSCAAPPVARELGIKYTRDSEEYAALARQTYRVATDAVQRAVQNDAQSGAGAWAVILDLDETVLDNSTYELERSAYGQPFGEDSWNAWVNRRAAAAVPGVIDFIAAVRKAGGHVAWISDRNVSVADATRDNLKSLALWNDDDRLCLQSADRAKPVRRAEVAAGNGACAWPGAPVRVVAFLGDQITDFPAKGESFPDAGSDALFGRTNFLLPNAMYGKWTTAVTRR